MGKLFVIILAIIFVGGILVQIGMGVAMVISGLKLNKEIRKEALEIAKEDPELAKQFLIENHNEMINTLEETLPFMTLPKMKSKNP